MKVTFLGHSSFLLESAKTGLLIDPRSRNAGRVTGDMVYATHHHVDHVTGVEPFLDANPKSALLCGETTAALYRDWEERVVTVKAGTDTSGGPWQLEFRKCRHGLTRLVENTGIIVRADGYSFGHPGDAAEFSAFYGERLDMFAVPISGLFTTSPCGAIRELKKFSVPPRVIVAMHWLWRSPKGFCRRARKAFPDSACVVPVPGEEIPWPATGS
jgi:L-ascorbate metabolism protein UlaG (beta-lactamase superfamily)